MSPNNANNANNENINEKNVVRFPFAVKLGVAISLLIVLSTGGSAYYIFQETRSFVLEDLGNRLKDIGRTGAYLFGPQERKDLRYLVEQVNLHSRFTENEEQKETLLGEDGEALTDDDDWWGAIPPALADRIMAGPAFQRVVQVLRKIREGSRESIRPLGEVPPLHVIRKSSDDWPTLEYIYMLTPVKGYPTEKYLIYLADSDYFPVEDDGTGEPNDGNSIGNVTLTLTPEMHKGFSGVAVAEQDFTEDQWGGVVISGYVPILDENKQVLAVLGMDYNVESQANRITVLFNVSLSIVAVTFILAVLLAVFLARWLNRPIAILQEGARKVAQRDFSVRVNVKTKDELELLANSFNSMTEEIKGYSEHMENLNKVYFRFVPKSFLDTLGLKDILDIRLGDQTQKDMTVLFSDIRSFTSLSEKLSAKTIFDLINSYLSVVGPVIRKHNGFVDKYIGDAVVALFPENASDALNAAMEIRSSLKDFNKQSQEAEREAIDIGIGVNSGSLMLGTIGEAERMETTVFADAVNVAARLEEYTKVLKAPILFGESTYQSLQAGSSFPHRYLGKLKIRGKARSVSVYQIFNDPNSTNAIFEEGVSFCMKGQYDDALSAFQTVCQKDPEDATAAYYLNGCESVIKRSK